MTTTTTAAPTTTTAPQEPVGPVVETGRRISWNGTCTDIGVGTTYGRTDTTLTWEFDNDPDLTGLEVRTRPSEASTGNLSSGRSGGFGLVNWQRHVVPVDDGLVYEFALPRGPGNPVQLDVDLVVEHTNRTTCEAPMFVGLVPPELSETEQLLTVPEGIVVDQSRYADLIAPEPTLEALVYAFAEYRGPHGMGDEEPEYSAWKVWDGKEIRDYEAELRHFLFGDTQDLGDWEAAAHMLEILAIIHPDLDPRFATTVEEVNFPQFHPICERWILVGDWMAAGNPNSNHPCQRNGNGAYFSDESTRAQNGYIGYQRSRGHLYHNAFVIDAEDLARPDARDEWAVGTVVNNPCCSINFHEVGHAVGLEHTYCAYSALSRWEDRPYMTAPWSADDLAGMAIHLDPRTTHGMDIHQAAAALGIERDTRFDEMVVNPWRACGRQDSGWNDFADRIYEDHVLSTNVGTNHPDNRTPTLYDR